jgi:hypothetical protein
MQRKKITVMEITEQAIGCLVRMLPRRRKSDWGMKVLLYEQLITKQFGLRAGPPLPRQPRLAFPRCLDHD